MKNTNNKQLKYIMYCRKSTDSEDRQVQSIEDQKKELQIIINRENLNVIKTFGESQSAKKRGRPMFNEMIRMIEQGEADGILCWKINRLARNPRDGGEIQGLLQEEFIKSIITPGREYLPTDNVLMMAVELGMANQFVLDLSKDVMRGLNSKVSKGWRPGRAPLGYMNDCAGIKGEKEIFADPNTFEIVRKMWDMLLEGTYTVPQIIRRANKEWGFRTKDKQTLSLSVGYKMFTNPFYYGHFMYKGELYEGKHKPMITAEEFDRAQNILGRKGKPRSKDKRLPFNGIVICGECGGMMTATEKIKFVKAENKNKTYIYHHCSHRKKDKVCHQKPIKHEDLIDQINEYFSGLTIPKTFLEWGLEMLKKNNKTESKNHRQVLKNLNEEYDRLIKKQKNFLDLYVSSRNINREYLTDEEFKENKKNVQIEIKKIEEKIKDMGENINRWVELTERSFKFATYAQAKFATASFEEKTNLFSALGENFILKDGKVTITLKNPFFILTEGFKKEPINSVRLELLKHPENALLQRKNSHLQTAFSQWSG